MNKQKEEITSYVKNVIGFVDPHNIMVNLPMSERAIAIKHYETQFDHISNIIKNNGWHLPSVTECMTDFIQRTQEACDNLDGVVLQA